MSMTPVSRCAEEILDAFSDTKDPIVSRTRAIWRIEEILKKHNVDFSEEGLDVELERMAQHRDELLEEVERLDRVQYCLAFPEY